MRNKHNSIIISPSGNLYGSERSLLYYINNTTKKHKVYIPKSSIFAQHIKQNVFHNKTLFLHYNTEHLASFYLRVFLSLIASRYYKTIYCNEGAHINYLVALAHLFPKKKILIHIRILEDVKRINKVSKKNNLVVLTNSRFMCERIKQLHNPIKINNPFSFSSSKEYKKLNCCVYRIGIIGRITKTKGIKNFISFLSYYKNVNSEIKLVFKLYGKAEKNYYKKFSIFSEQIDIEVKEFETDITNIYRNLDIVIHFAEFEPFGRIFLEAISNSTYFVGFNSGGIGEIAKELGLSKYMVTKEQNWEQELLNQINIIKNGDIELITAFNKASQIARMKYSIDQYCKSLDSFL